MGVNLVQLAGMSAEDKDKMILDLLAKQSAQRKVNKLTLKVGAKGGISVYGMGRFPITAYASQIERMGTELFGVPLGTDCPIYQFIEANKGTLARKDAAAE